MVCPLSRGLWYRAELEHINILELKAIQLEIYTCCKNKDFLHVSVVCDNVTAISYVNSMGAIRSQTCNNVASRIWDFCTKNQLWVSVAHIPGAINIVADKQSRVLEDGTEWKFNLTFFHKIVQKFGKPDKISSQLELISNQIDLSWHPWLEAMTINAFSLTWNSNYFCMFLLFSI